MKQTDARVRYTQMVIEKTFLEILEEKPVVKITVTELCQRAQINRATFYKHYLDVPDLLDKLELRLFGQIRAALSNHAAGMEAYLKDMLHYMQQEEMRFMILGSDHGDPNLVAKTFDVCYENAYPILKTNLPQLADDERRMLYYFIAQGSSGILTYWVRNGMKETPEHVIQFLLKVCSAAIVPFEH